MTCESQVEGWHYHTFGLCQGDRRPAGNNSGGTAFPLHINLSRGTAFPRVPPGKYHCLYLLLSTPRIWLENFSLKPRKNMLPNNFYTGVFFCVPINIERNCKPKPARKIFYTPLKPGGQGPKIAEKISCSFSSKSNFMMHVATRKCLKALISRNDKMTGVWKSMVD